MKLELTQMLENVKLVSVEITTTLQKEEIELRQVDYNIENATFTVITSKEVPENIKQEINKFANIYGFNVQYQNDVISVEQNKLSCGSHSIHTEDK
jgi:predicted regulator of amino acid metabolism with ACT domain